MKIRTPMTAGEIEKLTQARHDLVKATAAFRQAHHEMAVAISDMEATIRIADFFVADEQITRTRQNLPKTRKAFNGVSNWGPDLNATKTIEVIDAALAQAWD